MGREGKPQVKMADGECIRNSDWENDMMLKADFERYVHRNLQRQEILDFWMEYPMYAWSILASSLELEGYSFFRLNTPTIVFL